MKTKNKECKCCGNLTQLFSKGMCKPCWAKNYAKPLKSSEKPVNRISVRQKQRTTKYMLLREQYLKENPLCQAQFEECTHTATEIHHRVYGSSRSRYFLQVQTWWSICRSCHSKGHDTLSSEKAIELGFKLKI